MENTRSINDLIETVNKMENQYYFLNEQYLQLKRISKSKSKDVSTLLQQERSNNTNRNSNISAEITMASRRTPSAQKVTNRKSCEEANCSKLVQDRIKSFHSLLNNINNCKIKSEGKYEFLSNLEEQFDISSANHEDSLVVQQFVNSFKK